MNPFVSIITVTYNAEVFLEKTILSILKQTFSDFEYVIIDGLSKDSTVDIIKKYEQQIQNQKFTISSEQFRWISEPDKGLYDAMNKGIAMAKGKFIWFINAGDKIHSTDTLMNIYSLYKNNSTSDILYGQSLMIDQNDKALGERHKIAPENLSKKCLLNGLVVCHQSILVKKEMVPFYNLDYKIASDYDWVIHVVSQSKQNLYINGYLSDFMVAGTSTVNRKKAWKERYFIMKKHFGLCLTVWAHFKIILKYPFSRKY